MGITTSLRKLDEYEIKELNSFLENNIPQRDKLISNLGPKSFDTKYNIIVSRNQNSVNAGLLGCLSELYIDIVAGRYVETHCNILYEIFSMVVDNLDHNPTIFMPYKDSKERVLKCLQTIKSYVNNVSISDEQVIDALYTIYKHGHYPFNTLIQNQSENFDSLYARIFDEKLNSESIEEIKKIGALFLTKFVSNGILKKGSDIVINPRFGDWSETLGAEGDLYIDGIIYDIKSRSKEGYHKDEIEQVYGYYLCSILDKYFGVSFQNKKLVKKQSNMEDKAVNGIGLYMSRFGEIIKYEFEEKEIDLDKLKVIAHIIARSKDDRLNGYFSASTTKIEPIVHNVFKKQIFKNILLDKEVYKERNLTEYASYAYPAKVESTYDISYLTPIMWTGDYLPAEIKKDNLFFFIHFKASFYIKKGKDPFVRARSSLIYLDTTNMKTSDYFNKKDGRYYAYYCDGFSRKQEAMAEITMTKEDFDLFIENYHIRHLIILDGCYFA